MRLRKVLMMYFLLAIVSCKKDNGDEINSFDFEYSNAVASLPDTVFFTAIGNDVETVTWDFGDGGTAEGTSVSHIFNAYDCFTVSAKNTKGKANKTIVKDVPVTRFRRITFNSVEVLQIPLLGGNGQDWDPNDNPDLSLTITLPGDTIFQSPVIINNSIKGTFIISPAKTTYGLNSSVNFSVFDFDPGSVPEYYQIGTVNFNLCPPIPPSIQPSYSDSSIVSNGGLRLKIKYVYGI